MTMTEVMVTESPDRYAINGEPIPTPAELEARWRWQDHQDSYGDPRPDQDWRELSAVWTD
jgi:hypothetical protein